MATVSPTEIERLLAMVRLETREHPKMAGRLQVRYLANSGRWRWGPESRKRAPYPECRHCGIEHVFVQDNGVVYELCPQCRSKWALWWPARAYEIRKDAGASWRRAVRNNNL